MWLTVEGDGSLLQITSAASAGTNHLIRDRAAVLITNGGDVLSLLTTEQETNEQFADLKEQP